MYFTRKYFHLFNLTYSFPVAPKCDWNWGNHICSAQQSPRCTDCTSTPAGTSLSFSKNKSKFSCLFFKESIQTECVAAQTHAINVLCGLQKILLLACNVAVMLHWMGAKLSFLLISVHLKKPVSIPKKHLPKPLFSNFC